MDKIKIKGLELFAHHGVFPEENALGQKFIINAILYTDTRHAGITDKLEHATSYSEVCRIIKKYLTEHTFRLLESAAENMAKKLLLSFPLVESVDLEIKKPWAPIGLPLETVTVEVSRGWHTAYIALGSNMGDRQGYLDTAVRSLSVHPYCRVDEVSDYIVTAPYGNVEQDDFLNGALKLRTLLPPEELLAFLQELEQNAHRERTIHWGPRTLDLDILLYDDLVLDTPSLHIPHPELHLREFVLRPMAQIASWVRHPVTGQTIAQMLAKQNAKK